jgi:hypothetical protein
MATDTTTPKRPRTPTKPTSLVTKLTEVQASIETVEKKGYNSHHNYHYVMEPELFNAVRGGLSARNVMLVPSIESVERHGGGLLTIKMLWRIMDGDSGEVIEIPWCAEGHDSSDKAIMKAATAASKGLIGKLMLIPSMDANGEFTDSENPRTEVPVNTPRTPPPAPTGTTHPDKLYVTKYRVAKQGEKDGNAWTLYALEFSDGRNGSTFDDGIADRADHAKANNLAVTTTIEQRGKYPTVVELELALDGDA